MALVADSFHMLSDVLALGVAFACMKISKKRSRKNTFGWVRAEVLGALVNAVFLLALCFSIFLEAVKRLLEPEYVEDPLNILIVGAIGLLVNIIGILMFHSHASLGGHGHSHGGGSRKKGADWDEQELDILGKNNFMGECHTVAAMTRLSQSADGERPHVIPESDEYEENGLVEPVLFKVEPNGAGPPSTTTKTRKKIAGESSGAGQLNMHGVFLHIMGDALGSVIVIINAIVVWRVDSDFLRKYLDPSLSLLMVSIIASTTLPLLKESALILLQTAPKYMNVAAMKAKLLKFDGIVAVHEFHVWRLAGQRVIATAHVRFRSLADYVNAAEQIKSFFHDQEIHSTTIQPEFVEMSPANNEDLVSSKDCFMTCPPNGSCDVAATCCGPPLSITKSADPANERLRLLKTSKSAPKILSVGKLMGRSSKEAVEHSTQKEELDEHVEETQALAEEN